MWHKNLFKSLFVIIVATFVVVLVVYAATTIGTNISTGGTVLVGSDAGAVDFSGAKAIIAQGDTGITSTLLVSLVVEGLASGGNTGVGLYSIGKTVGSDGSYGIIAQSTVNNTADTAPTVGIFAVAQDPHAGGTNYAFLANASGGVNNYSFYGQAGDIYNNGDLLIGSSANSSDFISSNAHREDIAAIISQADSGQTQYGYNIGLISESAADADYGSAGSVGLATTYGNQSAFGLVGAVSVNNTADTAMAVGTNGTSASSHSGGPNTGIWSYAANSSMANYSFYGLAGDILNNGNATINGNINFSGIMTDVGASCTTGDIRIDTGGATKEFCYCQSTNSWLCAPLSAGPAD